MPAGSASDDVAEAISKESLAALRRVQEEVGPDGLHTLGTLLDAGVSPDEAARVLNDNQFADGFRTKDELKAFHDSLDGAAAVPEFHHLVLILVEELGHTISEAVAEVRNNRAFVLRLARPQPVSEDLPGRQAVARLRQAERRPPRNRNTRTTSGTGRTASWPP